jgi:N4-gp56 family major capsid protein
MAETVVPLNDPAAVVIYSRRVYIQALRTPTLAKLMAASLNAKDQTGMVQLFDEPLKGPGDTIKSDLIPNITGPGVAGDNPIAGNETALGWQQFTFTINQLRQAAIFVGKMSQQRVPWSARDAMYAVIGNWFKDIIAYGLLNQAAGNTAQTQTNYTGMQAPTAIDSSHQLYAGTATTNATLTSSMIMDLELITQAVAKAQGELIVPIKPVVVKGIEIAGMWFGHQTQIRDLKNNFAAGEWGNIFGMAMQGGQVTGNPIFTGAIGVYENVVLHSDAHVPWGDNSQNQMRLQPSGTAVASPGSLGAAATGTTSVATSVFIGAQGLAIAFGSADNVEGKPLRVRWYEELLDAGNQLRVTGGLIWGCTAPFFYGQTYGIIGINTFAAP